MPEFMPPSPALLPKTLLRLPPVRLSLIKKNLHTHRLLVGAPSAPVAASAAAAAVFAATHGGTSGKKLA